MKPTALLVFLIAMTASPAAPQAAPPVAYPKPPLPDRPVAAPRTLSAQPDCAGATPVALVPGDSLVFTGDTTGGPSLVDGYACRTWDESGPEAVFEITADAALQIHAVLDAAAELDLFLLSHCESDSCVAAHIGEFTAEIPAGVSYLVVDGYDGAQGPFELTVEAKAAGLPQEACDGAEAVTTFEDRTGNVLDRPDLVTMADCADFMEPGGEVWYALTVPPRTELVVTVQNQAFDAALWLFDACGESPACLGFVDAGLSGDSESFVILNDAAAPLEAILGVDSFRPVLSSQGDTAFDGAFDLVFQAEVPAERTSAGGLKRLFR